MMRPSSEGRFFMCQPLVIEDLRCRVNRGFVRLDLGHEIEQMLTRKQAEELLAWLAKAVESMPV